MSLEYRNEETEIAENELVGERGENVRRAAQVVPYFSIILIVCLVAVFICQLIADGQNSLLEGGELSILLAGFVKQFFRDGQYWRILTGAALHLGVLHLAFNSYALFVLGRLIETLSSRAHLAIVFLLSAVGGNLLSLIFLPENAAVGASGGIVGFLGYMTVYAFKRRKLLPEGFLKNMIFNIGLMAFFGLFVIPNVDNFGHLGGLLAGAIYGLVQIPGDLYRDPREIGALAKNIGYAALVIFIITCIFSALLLLKIVEIPFPFNPQYL